MKSNLKGFFAGFLCSALVFSSISVYGAGLSQTLNVAVNTVNVAINGGVVGPAGANYTLSNGDTVPYSILYKGTTYLPVRKVAELVGKQVVWDSKSNTAGINDASYSPPIQNEVNNSGKIFDDINVEATVRKQIGKLTGELTDSDFESVVSLTIDGPIVSLKGLEKLTNLERLWLTSTGVQDIQYLSELRNLKSLGLFGADISSIEPLRGLTNLEYLNLRYNARLMDIGPIAGMTNLKQLFITNTNVSNISPIVQNVQNGGFPDTDYGMSPTILLIENKLNLTNAETLNNLQILLDHDIKVEYLPQR